MYRQINNQYQRKRIAHLAKSANIWPSTASAKAIMAAAGERK